MSKRPFRTIALASVFGGFAGLVAAGVWAVDQPRPQGELYELVESEGDLAAPFTPPEDATDATFTGAGFWNFAPASYHRLPVSLWVALPVSTAVAGGVVGAAASAAGVRITRSRPASQ